MRFLVTGSAGFIGFYVTQALLDEGHEVVGIDNLNDYYDVELKKARLAEIDKTYSQKNCSKRYQFYQVDISDREAIQRLFQSQNFDRVIHLAAQAGVRYSIENPHAYVDSNLVGFVNILEGCRSQNVQHLIYASSSSVYGMNTKVPFSVEDRVDAPVSLYAATKKSNELMAFTYSHLYGIPTTGLRFFTVYGPWGRPDMAYFSFTEKILKGEPIKVFNHGQMERDFTYIDDIVKGILAVQQCPPETQKAPQSHAQAPYQLFNIGNHKPITLERFIQAIEVAIGKKANRIDLPMQPGDVPRTYADIESLKSVTDFQPKTEIEEGIERFYQWYIKYKNRL